MITGKKRFDADPMMIQSWQRLIDGKNIQPHDITMIKHEMYEIELKSWDKYKDLSHQEFHELAQEKYNYNKEVIEYYDKIIQYTTK